MEIKSIYLGVNSGTSADAVDCVFCAITKSSIEVLGMYEQEIPSALRNEVLQAVENSKLTVQEYYELKDKLSTLYIKVIHAAIEKIGIPKNKIKAIGVHGQTIHHKPDAKHPYTLQCVNSAMISQATKLPVIDDFRSVDIALGGQGAPLIPGFCRYLVACSGLQQATFLNLGGIANATVCNLKTNKLIGWDIGPANALIDIWIGKAKGLAYDHNGDWARSGKQIPSLLATVLKDAYFSMQIPKSTGRDYFSYSWLEKHIKDYNYEARDIQATLLALTVATIKKDLEVYQENNAADICYLYGKGVHNNFLVQSLQQALANHQVKTTAELGIPAEALEGALFAWLAHCYINKIAVDLSTITGANTPGILGRAYLT